MQRHSAAMFRALLLGICLWLVNSNNAKRILMLPTPLDSSHTFTMRKVYDELVQRSEITLVKMLIVEDDIPKLSSLTKAGNVSYMTHQSPPLDLAGLVAQNLPYREMSPQVQKVWGSACDGLLSDEAALAKVQEFEPDLIVGTALYVCTSMLSAKLGVPHVTVAPGGLMADEMMPWISGGSWDWHISPRLSYTTDMYGRFSHPKSFLERARHIVTAVDFVLHEYLHVNPFLANVRRKHGLDMTSEAVRRLELMHLFGGDLALEQPRPLPPKVKLIGAFLPLPAKPLPQELQDFIEGAGEHGAILISLGTHAQFGRDEIKALGTALARLPQRTIWKLTEGEIAKAGGRAALNLTANIKVAAWVPQNDILGHPRTRAFLSHMGANGLNEAAYHGVPVVAMPFFADQPMNAMKAVSKGFGVMLRRDALTEESALEAFSTVLGDSAYREAARKVSRRMQARKRTPLQEAGDWIEHALELEGDAYLGTPEEEMSWITLNNADVYAAFVVTLAAAVAVVWVTARSLCSGVALTWAHPHISSKKVL